MIKEGLRALFELILLPLTIPVRSVCPINCRRCISARSCKRRPTFMRVSFQLGRLTAKHTSTKSPECMRYSQAFLCFFLPHNHPLIHDPIGSLKYWSSLQKQVSSTLSTPIGEPQKYLSYHDSLHWMIIYPLFSPPFFVRNPGKLDILSLTYLWILASLNLPSPNKAMEIKSDTLATYSPWKFPAEISLSYSNPSLIQ